MILPAWINWLFLLVGGVFSLFYAIKAFDIFGVDARGKDWAWRVHQFWFNLAGSAVGWGAAWLLARALWQGLEAGASVHLGWTSTALAAVAFVGITGHLPFATAGLLEGIKRLALKVADREG